MICYYKPTHFIDKFLVAFKKQHVTQFFLKASSAEYHTCALKIGKHRYYQNINKKTGEIKEVEISVEAYKELLAEKVGEVLDYERYIIPLENGKVVNLDIFSKDLEERRILSYDQDYNDFLYYDWFGKDITDQIGNSYYSIAVAGMPEQLDK